MGRYRKSTKKVKLPIRGKQKVKHVETSREKFRKRSTSCQTNSILACKDPDSQEINTHFKLCEKLFLENKITPKNVWSLRIIDHFTALVNIQKFQKEPFQTAARALEICTKVYSCRVDDLHADAMRLLKTLGMKSYIKNGYLPRNNTEKKTQYKKKIHKLKHNSDHFVVKDVNSLLGPIPQLTGVPFKVEMDGEPENLTNLLTMIVPFDQRYCDHLRDRKTPGFLSYNQKDNVNEEIVEKSIPKIENFKICKEFEDFEFESFDINSGNLSLPNELENSINNIFTSNKGDPVMFDEIEFVSCLPRVMSLKRRYEEISTNDNIPEWFKSTLVAPHHWKNRKLIRSEVPYDCISERGNSRKRKRMSVEDNPVDFSIDPPEIDFTKKARRSKRPIDELRCIMQRNYLKRAPLDNSLMLMDYIVPERYCGSNHFQQHSIQSNMTGESSKVATVGNTSNISIICREMLRVRNVTCSKSISIKQIKASMVEILKGFTGDKSENVKHMMFSTIYEKLKANTSEEISVPMAFMALLHLATENPLKLTASENLKDVFISDKIP